MRLLNLLILSFSLFFYSCNSDKGNFSVSPPQGWVIRDSTSATKGKSVKMYAPVFSDTPIFIENISLSIVHFPDLSIYISEVLSSVKAGAYYFKETGNGTVKINKYKAKWEQHIIQEKKTDNPTEQKVYFIWDDGNIYMIVCSTKLKQMDNFQNKIDEVLDSFRILKEE